MSSYLPPLTPEQFQQVAAYSRDEPYCTLSLAAVELGFMSLDDLRARIAQEEAAASASTPAGAASSAPEPASRVAAAAVPQGASMSASLTRQEICDRAQRHAEAHNMGIVAAVKALGLEEAYAAASDSAPAAAEPALTPWQAERQAQADKASAYAREHGIDFSTAYQALGFDGEASAERAQEQVRLGQARKYATEHRVSLAAALGAVGHAS